MAKESGNSIKKEILLILLGAIISASTITGTNLLNNRLELQKITQRSKVDFTKDLAEITGKRLFTSFSLFRANRDSTEEIRDWRNKYFESIEDWNSKSAYYFSLLEFYFDQETRIKFVNNIYKPLLDFGIKANARSFTSEERIEMNELYTELNSNTISFISDLLKK